MGRTIETMMSAAFVGVVMFAPVAAAGQPTVPRCNICTCTNEEVVCVPAGIMEVAEEGVCGPACSGIGSTFDDIELSATPCFEILACNGAQRSAPAAGPLWLSAAALGMTLFGGLALRRRSRTARA